MEMLGALDPKNREVRMKMHDALEIENWRPYFLLIKETGILTRLASGFLLEILLITILIPLYATYFTFVMNPVRCVEKYWII